MTQAQQTRHTPWTTLFWIAAAYNVIAALGPLLMPKLFVSLFLTTPPANIEFPLQVHMQLTWFFVLSFGLGYAMVAMNPEPNRGIVWLGLVGKAFVMVLFGIYWFQGMLQIPALLGGLGDGVFAALFGLYLMQTKEDQSTN